MAVAEANLEEVNVSRNEHIEVTSLRCIVKRIIVGIINDVDDYLARPAKLHWAKRECSLGTESLMYDTLAQSPMWTV